MRLFQFCSVFSLIFLVWVQLQYGKIFPFASIATPLICLLTLTSFLSERREVSLLFRATQCVVLVLFMTVDVCFVFEIGVPVITGTLLAVSFTLSVSLVLFRPRNLPLP
jgi:hypothetical protein